ncbi:MAG TPA: methyl-accepting chemotaxis protein [Usitatibacter sp.]|nr:methyl-accepting chemotaxis protein [Usitatibacter sp.]
MNPFRKLASIRSLRFSRLQVKVLGIVAASMAVGVVVALAALTRVYGTAKDLERISGQDFQAQLGIVRTELAFKAQTQEWKNVLLRGATADMLSVHWDAFLESEKLAQRLASDAKDATQHPEVAGALEAFAKSHAQAGEGYRRALEALKRGDAAGADKAAAGIDRGATEHLEEADALAQELGSKLIIQSVEASRKAYVTAIMATIFATLAGLIGVWLFIRRAVLAPVLDAGECAERIAAGDLTGDIRGRSGDEVGQLLDTLGRMNAGLSTVVSQVRGAAESVVHASGEVAAGTTDLSQRTEEQASSLQETAASMEELSTTVRQNAESAREADELALSASKRAEQGGREVARVVVTMSEISDGARRIADIISVIDGIAFQTNILALNAAVEAARAGEQGRGFAVVAAEVRSLAQRSAQAAKEIKELIGASVAQVDNGTRLVDQAGGTIAALVGDVKRVSGLMRSIAEASAEQSRGVQQVNKTVTEMDKVVQQNASAVQQASAAAEAMRREAESLLDAVGAFRIERDGAPDAPETAAPRASETRRPAPAAFMPAPPIPGDPRVALAAAGDEWEEF